MRKKIIGITVGTLLIIGGYVKKKVEEISKQPAVKKMAENSAVKEIVEMSDEAVTHSKRIKESIDRQTGIKKVIGYSALATATFIVFGVPGILTALVAGKIGWRYIQKK